MNDKEKVISIKRMYSELAGDEGVFLRLNTVYHRGDGKSGQILELSIGSYSSMAAHVDGRVWIDDGAAPETFARALDLLHRVLDVAVSEKVRRLKEAQQAHS